MSYINDALKKAQRERDGRYERFGGIIASGPERAGAAPETEACHRSGGRAAGPDPGGPDPGRLRHCSNRLPSKKDPPQPVVAGNPAGVSARRLRRQRGTGLRKAVPAGATPGRVSGRKDGSPGGRGAGDGSVKTESRPCARRRCRYQEALTAQRRGDLRGAEELYQKVLTLDPGHVRALNNLGVIYMEQKKREQGDRAFQPGRSF